MMNLGRALRCYAIVEGVSTAELAVRIGIPPRSIVRIENGQGVEGATVLALLRWLTEPSTPADPEPRKEPVNAGAPAEQAVA